MLTGKPLARLNSAASHSCCSPAMGKIHPRNTTKNPPPINQKTSKILPAICAIRANRFGLGWTACCAGQGACWVMGVRIDLAAKNIAPRFSATV
jgi:hypothetical protein